MKTLAFIRVIPIGTGGGSLSTYVAEALKVIKAHGLNFVITPLGTGVEANSIHQVAEIINAITSRLKELGVPRVGIDAYFDIRFDKEISLKYKVRSVEETLN